LNENLSFAKGSFQSQKSYCRDDPVLMKEGRSFLGSADVFPRCMAQPPVDEIYKIPGTEAALVSMC